MVVEFDNIVVGNTDAVETDDSLVVETDYNFVVVVKVLEHDVWFAFAGQARLIELLVLSFNFLIILYFRLLSIVFFVIKMVLLAFSF
jgi:hypothetical protein